MGSRRDKGTDAHVLATNSAKNPLISVVIPVFGRAVELQVALNSVLKQANFSDFEIIVVDDGSTPAINPSIAALDARITLIRHEQNKGAAAARNTGAQFARGPYLAFLDSDDVWLEHKLDRQLKTMLDAECQISTTHFYVLRAGSFRIRPAAPDQIDLMTILMGCFLCPGSTLMVAHDFYHRVGEFDENLKRLEDWDWLIRATQQTALLNIQEPLSCVSLRQRPSAANVLTSLSQLSAKDFSLPKDKMMAQRFRAALEYEEAVAHFTSGDRAAGVAKLLSSLKRTSLLRTGMLPRRLTETRIPTRQLTDTEPHLAELLKVATDFDD